MRSGAVTTSHRVEHNGMHAVEPPRPGLRECVRAQVAQPHLVPTVRVASAPSTSAVARSRDDNPPPTNTN